MVTLTTLTLDREQRDVVVDYIRRHTASSEELASALLRLDHGEIRELAAELDWICEVFEQVGWHEHGRRDTYRLAIDLDVFGAWLTEQRRGVSEYITGEARALERIWAGATEWIAIGQTQAEAAADTEYTLAGLRRDCSVFDRLIDAVGRRRDHPLALATVA